MNGATHGSTAAKGASRNLSSRGNFENMDGRAGGREKKENIQAAEIKKTAKGIYVYDEAGSPDLEPYSE